jgi:hypothetical protein
MNKGGFSWKRFVGISAMKSRFSRAAGIPLTKSGRQRKIGRIITVGGCLLMVGIGISFLIVVVSKLFRLAS